MPWPTLDSLVTESFLPPRWLIQDLLYQQSIICLAGVPGVGKSILAYTAAVAVASGVPFLGLPVAQGRVLYLDEENGPANMPTYFRWAWRGLGSPALDALTPNLRIGQNAILSHNGSWLDLLLAEVRRFRPALIIFDTATKCFRIRDENDNSEATRVLSALSLIQAAADNSTSILVLRHAIIDHHPDGTTHHKMRGASAWNGGGDGVIFHLARPGRPRDLRPTYLEPNKTRAYGLRNRLNITPTWTSDDPAQRGLRLGGHASEPEI